MKTAYPPSPVLDQIVTSMPDSTLIGVGVIVGVAWSWLLANRGSR